MRTNGRWQRGMLTVALMAVTAAASAADSVCGRGDLIRLGAVQAAERIRSGEISSHALVTALLERIRANPQLNAFITVNADGALAAAERADQRIEAGRAAGALLGVPVVVKDNIDVAGLPSTAGTPALTDNIPHQSAPVVQALVEAGAIVLGKTNMHELAFGITSVNAAFGPVRNPYNPLTFAGGSSGGTAAAIAARMAPAGLGTDTGGSSRIPAALTGVVGFRPSVDRYSRNGIVPISSTRDTAGIMARSVAGIILLDGVITGTRTTRAPADLGELRLGVPRAYFFDNLDPGTRALVENALSRLKARGVELVEADLENIGEINRRVGFPMAVYEVLRTLPEYLQGTDPRVTLDEVVAQVASPDVRAILKQAIGPDGRVGTSDDAVSESVYDDAIEKYRPRLQALYRDYFKAHDVDAIVFPTTPLPARLIEGSRKSVTLNGKEVPTFPTYIRNTDPGSNAGLPGLTLPIGVTPEGLPVGLELDGPAGSDERLLAIGLAVEQAMPETPAPVLAPADARTKACK